MTDEIPRAAYQLWCVVEGSNADRETILSYSKNDADLDQPHRISGVDDLLRAKDVAAWIHKEVEETYESKGSWIRKKRNVEEGSEEYRELEIKKKQCEAVIEVLEKLQSEVLNETPEGKNQ